MGQSISLYTLSLIDKQVYAVQNVLDVEYPRALKKVRERGTNKIINLFECVAVSSIKDKKKTVKSGIFDMFP